MIYDEISNGIKIRSRCNWFEFGEKSNKFFLNLEKKRGSQNTIRKIISDEEEITDLKKINHKIFSFYQDLFSKKCNADNDEINLFLENIKMPKLSNIQEDSCEGTFDEKEIFEAVKSFQNNKSPGNDGLTKEFYIAFWEEIKKIIYVLNIRIEKGETPQHFTKTSDHKTNGKTKQRQKIYLQLEANFFTKF